MITAVRSVAYALIPGCSLGFSSLVVPLLFSSIFSRIGLINGVPEKKFAFACCCYAGVFTVLLLSVIVGVMDVSMEWTRCS